MNDSTLAEFMSLSKALADKNRVRILAMLEGRTLCVCQVVAVLGLAPSTVSKHLAVLRQAGLLETQKRGRWIYCRLDGKTDAAKQALSWIRASLKRAEPLENDRLRLGKVLKINPERLCGRTLR